MKFARAYSVQGTGTTTNAPRLFIGILLGLGVLIIVVSIVLLLLLASNSVFDHLKPKDRDVYIELCLQSANLVLTIAALAVHPARLRTLVWLCQYLISPSESIAQSLSGVFPSLPLEFHNQECPSGVNTPLRKVLLLVVLLNGQCIFQYPITLLFWVVPPLHRPYSLVLVFLALSFVCCVASFAWELRLIRHTTRFRERRAESAFEKYLVEDTTI